MRAGPAVAFACLIATLHAPRTARAQQRDTSAAASAAIFRGRVIQKDDSTPVANADVWLVSVDRHATTDSTGGFRFDGVPPGMHLIQIRRVGVAPQRATIALSADHENVVTFALTGSSVNLDTVRTTAGAQKYLSPQLRGFEERRLSGQGGHFISDSVLRKNENTTAANLISGRIPGLMQETITGPGKLVTALVSTRKSCAGPAFSNSCKGGAPNCYVAVYLDGVLQYSPKIGGAPPDFRTDYEVSNLAGIEFYAGGAASPIGMHSDDDGCGSIWLWTRER